MGNDYGSRRLNFCNNRRTACYAARSWNPTVETVNFFALLIFYLFLFSYHDLWSTCKRSKPLQGMLSALTCGIPTYNFRRGQRRSAHVHGNGSFCQFSLPTSILLTIRFNPRCQLRYFVDTTVQTPFRLNNLDVPNPHIRPPQPSQRQKMWRSPTQRTGSPPLLRQSLRQPRRRPSKRSHPLLLGKAAFPASLRQKTAALLPPPLLLLLL